MRITRIIVLVQGVKGFKANMSTLFNAARRDDDIKVNAFSRTGFLPEIYKNYRQKQVLISLYKEGNKET